MPKNQEQSLIDDTLKNLERIKELADKSQALTSKDKEACANLLNQYQGFVENLNLKPGEEQQTDSVPILNGLPFHAGNGDVEPCL